MRLKEPYLVSIIFGGCAFGRMARPGIISQRTQDSRTTTISSMQQLVSPLTRSWASLSGPAVCARPVIAYGWGRPPSILGILAMSTSVPPGSGGTPPAAKPLSKWLKSQITWAGYKTFGFILCIPLGLKLVWQMLLSPSKALGGFSWGPTPPPLPDPIPGLQHDWVMADDGTKLHLVRTCANDGGRKPVALLLHGFPEGWFSWRHQMEALREAGWCAVAMDLRGYGASDKPQDVASYRMECLVEDVVSAIRAVAPPGSSHVAALCGHDWGGIIAWHVAHLRPDLIGRLAVLCAPHPACFGRNMDWDQAKRSWYVAAFQTPWIPEAVLCWDDCATVGNMIAGPESGCRNPAALTEQDVQRYRQAFAAPGTATAGVNYYRAALDYGLRVGNPRLHRALREKLRVPTLVLWGDKDIALGPQLLRGMDRYIEELRVREIEDASHWLQQDRWEEVNHQLLEVLGKH